MKVIVKNKGSDAFSFISSTLSIPAYSETEIAAASWFGLYTDTTFLEQVKSNNLIISDGLQDLSTDAAMAYLERVNEFNYNNKDMDGALIVRTKAAKKGWSFWAVPIEFTTARLVEDLYCKDSNGIDVPGITIKNYNANNQEITEAGLANINLAASVKTVVDFEPAFDFEIIGGALRINSNPAQDVRLWIVGAPDIPAVFGGSKEFASGINLKFLAPDSSFDIDGRVTKFITYNPVTHQGKIRILLKHPPGLAVNLQVVIHIYRL